MNSLQHATEQAVSAHLVTDPEGWRLDQDGTVEIDDLPGAARDSLPVSLSMQ